MFNAKGLIQNRNKVKLHDYNIIIINSSGGKDSLCSIYEICRMADEQNYPKEMIVVSHQDLGRMEWQGTKELAERQANHFGLKFYVSKRRNSEGHEETLLEYVERRGKWPSNKQRYCTSDFKRGPGARVVTMLSNEIQSGNGIERRLLTGLYVFGFRADESPSRRKKQILKENKVLTTNRRKVFDYLPIHEWSKEQVWQTIKANNLPYHFAYDLGMPRLSCVFCIFSPFDALVRAGYANRELLDEYVAVEERIGHTFRDKFAIREVRDAIERGYQPKEVTDWVM